MKPFYTIIFFSLFSWAGTCFAQIDPWIAPDYANRIKNPIANNAKETEKAKKVYFTVCNVCHGDHGRADGIAALPLRPKPANFTTDEVQNQTDGVLFWKLTNGRGPKAH